MSMLKQPERPNVHDSTNSILDELKFIQVMGPSASIEVGSFFFFTYLPIKNKFAHLPTIPNQTTYLHPMHLFLITFSLLTKPLPFNKTFLLPN
jgi:hypothetical protein